MKRLRWLLVALSLISVLSVPTLAEADVNDFAVTNFVSDQTLTRQDKQGQLRIVERINVDFSDFNHGILRAIPNSYKHHSLQMHVNGVSSDSGAPTKFTTYSSNGNTVLKIGDANKTITGTQEYTIDYTVDNVIGFYKDHSELYWDVNGDQWLQPFEHVEVRLHLPDGLQQTEQPSCYTGGYGSTQHNCQVLSDGNTILGQTTQPLGPYQTLTYVAVFKPGYFQPSTWYETLAEHTSQIVGVLVPILVLGGSGFVYWWRHGRDAKGRGVIVPQYDPPDNMTPLQVDGLVDFSVGNTAITATIISLAIRGYIQIIETKEDKKLRKDTISYSLKLSRADLTGLDSNEQGLLAALFSDMTSGEIVDVTKQKNKLYSTAGRVRGAVEKSLKADGYFRSKIPEIGHKSHTGLKVLTGIALLIAAAAYGGFASIAGFVIGGIIAIVCLASLDALTEKGIAAKEHAEGLKLYLNVAEKDRLKKLQGPNAEYAPKTKEPAKTVKLFEKLLPYAMVLGVEQGWAKQFEGLYTQPPDWYVGHWTTFNAYYMTQHLNQGIGSAVNTAFSAPSSSSSSGSGGGGFSGGGGGGGGGGGW